LTRQNGCNRVICTGVVELVKKRKENTNETKHFKFASEEERREKRRTRRNIILQVFNRGEERNIVLQV